ncbi:MAG: hypothetical protein K5746_09535 [Clostridiales bacterium]|nr:hypothetical protein [Clostridiales bacterium]
MSVISDKQALRRCLKQYLRNIPVVEPFLRWNRMGDDPSSIFLQRVAQVLSPRTSAVSLLSGEDCACLSALKKLGFSGETKDELTKSLGLYSKEAWLREVLEAGMVRRAYVPIRLADPDGNVPDDECLRPILFVDKTDFIPGRFGIDYRSKAEEIRATMRTVGCRFLCLDEFDEEILKYCLLPVCEEEGTALRLTLRTDEETEAFFALAADAGYLHVILRTEQRLQPDLIRRLAGRDRFLLSLNGFQDLPLALSVLRLHFIPYESQADSPEMMIGKWAVAREQLWPALLEAYLPTARTGYPLTAEKLEEDLIGFLGGTLLEWE